MRIGDVRREQTGAFRNISSADGPSASARMRKSRMDPMDCGVPNRSKRSAFQGRLWKGNPSGGLAKGPRWGAKTRRNSSCQAPAMRNPQGRYTRCPHHGAPRPDPEPRKGWNDPGVPGGRTGVTPKRGRNGGDSSGPSFGDLAPNCARSGANSRLAETTQLVPRC